MLICVHQNDVKSTTYFLSVYKNRKRLLFGAAPFGLGVFGNQKGRAFR